uniref:Major facilitator superfamily (MFS) profile domain-containing protein n=1 Tax=Strigamia maritima TaxID=126957 RepID=T1IXM3_STRMM
MMGSEPEVLAPKMETHQLLKKPQNNLSSILKRYFNFEDTEIVQIWKDVFILGIAYFTFRLCYLSYIFNLGVLFAPDLAFITLATSFGAETLTSLFLPTLVIRTLGCKIVIVLISATTLLFGLAEFMPSYYTFIPCGMLLGAGYSCLWVALATYLTNISQIYVKLREATVEAILGLFFGIVCFLGALGGVLGNIITYVILEATEETIDNVYFGVNRTVVCGAQYCEHPLPVAVNASVLTDKMFTHNEQKSRTTLFLIYIGLGLIGPLAVSLFLNRRQKLEEAMRKTEIGAFQQIVATVMALKNINLALLSVSCFLNGITFSFASGNFSQAYVDCAVGSEFVAIVAVVHLIAYSLASVGSGILLKYISIMKIFLFVNITAEVVYVLMLVWKPDTDGLLIASAFSGWLGAFVAIYTNLLNTICGIILHGNREATFAFFRLFYSLGSTVGFAATNHTCAWIMITVFMVLIVIGTVLYLIAEYRIRIEKKAAASS